MTTHRTDPAPTRLLLGALGGLVATAAMTAAMRRLHARLPAHERYPLPPREITERTLPGAQEDALQDATIAAHFGFGAAAGAATALAFPRLGLLQGMAAGLAVWTASYFGWVPGARILEPASSHPPRRNALMIGVHLVWGAVTALVAADLAAARRGAFAAGPLADAAPRPPTASPARRAASGSSDRRRSPRARPRRRRSVR